MECPNEEDLPLSNIQRVEIDPGHDAGLHSVGRYRSENPLTVMEIRLPRWLLEVGTSCV
jgi:hypothetical protein